MTAATQQTILAVILVGMLAAFISGRWRFDIVAVAGLLAAVAVGVVPAGQAFSGFGSDAVATVAAVLILTHALGDAGLFERLASRLLRGVARPAAQLAILCGLAAAASAFMNNIGALALFMPAAIGLAQRNRLSPGLYLLPLSYATLLGGMATLIGTPANLLIANFRAQATGEAFSFLAFAPVGLPLAALGVACLAWRAARNMQTAIPDDHEPSVSGDYDTELIVGEESPLVGRSPTVVGDYGGAQVYGMVRAGRRVFGRIPEQIIQPEDILLLRADSATLGRLTAAGLRPDISVEHETLTEVVVAPNALLQGSCAATLDLPERYGVELAAAARQGRRAEGRLAELTLSMGDVLALRGDPAKALAAAADLGCLPLAGHGLTLHRRNGALVAAIFITAVLLAAFEILPPAIAFIGGALALALTGAMRPGDLYRAVDWPVIVLLAAMIPLGDAIQHAGLAARLGEAALGLAGDGGPAVLTVLMLAAAMLLTPFLNNPATVLVLAPVALGVAARLGISPDPFLMAVAVGASCDFLTPFGHHNNALVMGPGGYRFGDYARLGWRLELLALVAGSALIITVWL